MNSDEKNNIIGARDLYPALAAIPICRRYFGFVPQEDDLLETVLDVLDATGNTAATTEVLWAQPVEDHFVELPFTAGAVTGVSASEPGIRAGGAPSALLSFGHLQPESHLPPETLVGSPASQAVELDALLQAYKTEAQSQRPTGAFVGYRAEGERSLYLPGLRTGSVDITYQSMPLDEQGYPLVHKEVLKAVAYWLQFVNVRMRFYLKESPMYMLQQAEKDKNTYVNQAKVGAGFTEQGMTRILDVLHSRHRHKFGSSFRAGR
jgi:hypothetical protein